MKILIGLILIAFWFLGGIAATTIYRKKHQEKNEYRNNPLMLKDLFRPNLIDYCGDDSWIVCLFPAVFILYILHLIFLKVPSKIIAGLWGRIRIERRERFRNFFERIGEKELLK